MNSPRLLSALFAAFAGCLLLVAGCAQPSPSGGPTCSTGQMACGMECRNVASDNANCGMCGRACGTGQICTAGACTCAAGLMNCNGACVGSTAQNCGASCMACPSGQSCSNGACSATCAQNLCPDGACVPANGDGTPAHCGGCTACPTGATCSNNACVCAASGQKLCNNQCVDTMASNAHCGNCNQACSGTCMNGVCMTTTGTGGAGGRGGSGTPGTAGAGGSGPAGAGGGAAGRGGSGAGTAGVGGGTAGSTGGSGAPPPGYWIFTDNSPSYTWNGCVWTGVDSTVAGSTTAFTMPASKDFTGQTGTTGPYRVAGRVFSNYDAVALLGFNTAQPAAGASCVYKPVTTGDPPLPAAPLPAGTTGIAINWGRTVGSQFRIQIQGPNGANDANDRWCYNIADAGGPSFAPYAMFNTKCWDNTGTNYPASNLASKPISAIVFLVPGTTAVQNFDFTINGFAAGTSAADAPSGGTVVLPMGTIGGAGSTDLDFQRVKVRGKDGKDYVIQNNNWGNPSGSNQTLSYVGNSFKITSVTGGEAGGGAPASFPSIYVGASGNVANGSYSTHPADNLPKRNSELASVNTTMSVSGASGDMNVTYDVWFNATTPNLSSYPYVGYPEYKDGVSGFVMVWYYKPGNRQPIGSIVRTYTHSSGKVFDVWVGPRGGGSNAPVVSYVAKQTMTTWTFDLKAFITDAAQHGIQSTWYLTDVFGGAEIWTGSSSSNFEMTEFSVDVK